MSCMDFEEHIWLYDELSPEQKILLDKHLLTCADCKMIWEQAQALAATSKVWQEDVPAVEHEAQLTHKIMGAIESKRDQKNSLLTLIDLINTRWLRYSMASLSVLLVITFLYDRPFAEHSTETVSHEIPEAASLTRSDFIKDRIKVKKTDDHHFSLLACIENRSCPPLIIEKKKYYENR